ncbi:hypothetical protein JCM10212_002469 [Sporobolomyces blumeae]
MSFFKGTSTDQDPRFKDKQAMQLKKMSFPPSFEQKVDMRKVEIAVMKPWIAKKVIELLGFEDDVLIEYINSLLEDPDQPIIDAKNLQILLTGFLEKKTALFMEPLWNLLLSAQSNPLKVPTELLEEKKREMRERAEKEAVERRKQEELEAVRRRERGGFDNGGDRGGRGGYGGYRGGDRGGRGGYGGGERGGRDGIWAARRRRSPRFSFATPSSRSVPIEVAPASSSSTRLALPLAISFAFPLPGSSHTLPPGGLAVSIAEPTPSSSPSLAFSVAIAVASSPARTPSKPPIALADAAAAQRFRPQGTISFSLAAASATPDSTPQPVSFRISPSRPAGVDQGTKKKSRWEDDDEKEGAGKDSALERRESELREGLLRKKVVASRPARE